MDNADRDGCHVNAGTRPSALNPTVTKRRTGAPIPEAPEYLSVVYSVVRSYWGVAWLWGCSGGFLVNARSFFDCPFAVA